MTDTGHCTAVVGEKRCDQPGELVTTSHGDQFRWCHRHKVWSDGGAPVEFALIREVADQKRGAK